MREFLREKGQCILGDLDAGVGGHDASQVIGSLQKQVYRQNRRQGDAEELSVVTE
jgi:hypothetical protein